jgi:hypothetical protein
LNFFMNDKLMVNAAIAHLIEKTGDWKEEARTVIDYGHKLPKAIRFTGDVKFEYTKPDDSISGQTSDHGTVDLKMRGKVEKKHSTLGVQKERIGDFRLWKDAANRIRFHYFWRSDFSTKGSDDRNPDEYVMAYDQKTLEPKYLAVQRSRVLFRIGWLKFSFLKYYLESLHGEAPSNWYTGIELGH